MTPPKIMTIYGTRPEAIKVAPLIKALRSDTRFESVVVSTGQHKEMLQQVNYMFGIEPNHDLEIMGKINSLNDLVSLAVAGLDQIISDEKPDVIISQGDTSTAMSAALAGFNREVKIVHLEAGLRTGNIHSPFPEEANRKIIGQLAELHLAPTADSKENLLRENFNERDIAVVGNTVIDALLEATTWTVEFSDPKIKGLEHTEQQVVLVTTHRRENLQAMTEISAAIKDLAQAHPATIFTLPLHLNPLVRDVVLPEVEALENVIVTDPLPYDQFTKLMKRSTLILTDSGGVQEEAPSLGIPVLCMRDNTERPEAVEAGTVRLIGTDRARIFAETSKLLTDKKLYSTMSQAINPYGDGKAAERSVAAIGELLGLNKRLPDFNA